MSAPGTVELMLLRAVGNGEITYGRSAGGFDDLPEGWGRFEVNGAPADTAADNWLGILADQGYLAIADEDADQSTVTLTAAGEEAIL